MSAKKNYEKEAKSQLEAWDIRINKLKADIEKAKLEEIHAQSDAKQAREALSDAQIEHYKQEFIDELQEKRTYAGYRLDEIMLANEQHWEHLKEDAEKVWRALDDAIDAISLKVESFRSDAKGVALGVIKYSFDEQEKATAQAKELVGNIGDGIDGLESKANKEWDQMNEGVRRSREEIIKTLKQKHSDISELCTSLKQSSEDGWHDVNKGFSTAYNDISDSFKRAQEEFKKHKRES